MLLARLEEVAEADTLLANCENALRYQYDLLGSTQAQLLTVDRACTDLGLATRTAREEAAAEHDALCRLEQVYEVYKASAQAREAAEQALATACKAENAQAEKVNQALSAI